MPAPRRPGLLRGRITVSEDFAGLGGDVPVLTETVHTPVVADEKANKDRRLEFIRMLGEVPQPAPGPLAAVISGLMAKQPRDRMPLRTVRQEVYPLLTKAPRVLFGPEMAGNVLLPGKPAQS